MQERIDLVVVAEERRKAGGLSVSVVVSLVLHALLLIWFIRSYRAIPPSPQDVPIARYIELMKQNPREFVEAPGPAVERAPMNAPLSDRNRKASMPEPTGSQPTTRPGQGGRIYTPPSQAAGRGGPQQQAVAASPGAQPQNDPFAAATTGQARTAPSDASLVYREPTKASASGIVDWRSAIRQAGRDAVAGGGDGIDLASIGGDQGFAEQGPLSFETQWYDWGEYAQSMVSRIRVNWYANMPQIIRTGMKGVVTIRFTIHRDGRISDITILKSSGVPPYDQAARKAIELSSPLKPLPKDFPNPTERVTCMFYYNMEIPQT
ncbi:MAG TPA: TonB family protein [Thermoanaerobaculia bacterium]|nr:TonB family protein [Thermoanaerobaculia bacterium]